VNDQTYEYAPMFFQQPNCILSSQSNASKIDYTIDI
jgi:hypothetical protein